MQQNHVMDEGRILSMLYICTRCPLLADCQWTCHVIFKLHSILLPLSALVECTSMTCSNCTFASKPEISALNSEGLTGGCDLSRFGSAIHCASGVHTMMVGTTVHAFQNSVT